MAALVYGFVRAASDGWGEPRTIGSFAAGLVLLAAFVRDRAAGRVADHAAAAVRRSQPRSSYVARLLLVAGMIGMFFFLTQFLQGVLGYSALKTGFAFLPMTVDAVRRLAAERARAGRAFGARRLMIVGITFSTLGMVWLTQLGASSGYLDAASARCCCSASATGWRSCR